MRTCLAAKAAVLATVTVTVTACGLLLGACGSGTGAPEGWRTLDAGEVRVLYPKGGGWKRLTAGAAGKNTTAVVMERDGAELARILVRKRFMTGGDTGVAAAGAMASLQPGATIQGTERLTIDGRDAEKVEYTYQDGASSRQNGARRAADGARVRGVDLVTLDSAGDPLLVRINAAPGSLTDVQLRRVVNSVTFDD